MYEWIAKIFTRYVSCFQCGTKMARKSAFSVTLNTAEGPFTMHACEQCAGDVNDVLKAIQEVKNDSPV
jgi:hypothetical protein|tara:strand:+ start:708 stop:911 length:204 start_codon:yes stop_codon:yes gene_type:complete